MKHKKIIMPLFTILLFIGMSFSASLTLAEPDPNTIYFTIKLDSIDLKEHNNLYDLSAEGFGKLLIQGKPDLPSKIFTIGIPPGKEISSISVHQSRFIPLKKRYFQVPIK
jgi:hypothetical protein